jgi:dTDP-4-amino-4,6-dideoxygalactose transaminase
MGLSGKVILPAFTFVASAQSLSMAGIEPVFCDINRDTHQIDIDQIHSLIDEDVSAIMGVNLWGGSCDPVRLSEIAQKNDVQLYFDSAQALGCEVGGAKIGGFGRAEVFSFHATKILSATEGGCICTNDDELAERLRNIRSSYGTRRTVSVKKTSNGRMSEAQAAIGLMSLDDFSKNQNNNESLHRLYESRLSGVPGLHLVEPACVSRSNYQYMVYRVDEEEFGLSRDLLIELLQAENIATRRYFYPGLHRTIPYSQQAPQYLNRLPITDQVSQSCLQLPIGQLVSPNTVELICDIVSRAHRAAELIRTRHDR